MKQAFAPVRSFEAIYLALFVVLLGIQLYFAAFYESTVWSYDDYDYVVRSLDTITSDHLFLHDTTTGNEVAFSFKRVLNSWDIYIAYLSKVTRFHVTTIAHTVIPVIFLLVAYMVYYYLAVQLFDQRENRWIFMSILSVAFMFGLYSPYSLTFRLLVTLWQGKAVLSAIIVPFMIGFLPKAYLQAKDRKRIHLYFLVISMAACSLTMMGAGMYMAVSFIMLAAVSIHQRHLTGLGLCLCGSAVPAVQILVYLVMR